MKASRIIEIMEEIAPKKLIDSWDNTGLQIGDPTTDVKRILLALDMNHKVLNEAKTRDCQMIITHHPLIFTPIKTIAEDNVKSKLIAELIRNHMVFFSAHSNLDQSEKGVNYCLGQVLGINEHNVIVENAEFNNSKIGYGTIGKIKKQPLLNYLETVKNNLNCDNLVVYGDMDKEIEIVAACGGAGIDFMKEAREKGAELYITGDIKYHQAQDAVDIGLTLVDAGHFETEIPAMKMLKDYLELNTDIDIVLADPIIYRNNI